MVCFFFNTLYLKYSLKSFLNIFSGTVEKKNVTAKSFFRDSSKNKIAIYSKRYFVATFLCEIPSPKK